MPGFEDMLHQIGQILGTIGGNVVSAINTAGAVQHGGLPQMLAQQTALRDDPAFRQQVGQPGFMSALQGGMAGLGFPQIGPDPNVVSAGYGNQGQLIGPTARTNLPPLSPYAQAEQAKNIREATMGSMTPAMAAQQAAALNVGQPGGPSRFTVQTPYGTETFGGTPSRLPQGDEPPVSVKGPDGLRWVQTPAGWQHVPAEKAPAEEPDLGVPVDTSGQPMAAPPAPTRGQPPPPPQQMVGVLPSASERMLGIDSAPPPIIGQAGPWSEGFVTPAAAQDNSQILDAMGMPQQGAPAQPQAAPSPVPGSPPGLNLPPGARMKDGAIFVPSGMSAKGQVSYSPYKPPSAAKITYPSATLSAWASGTDPGRGGAPATPDQIAAGKAWQQNQVEQKKKGAGAVASQKPLGQQTIQNLATAASIKSLANQIRPMLDKPEVQRWVGPIAGLAAWELYSEVGYVPNEAIGSLITLGEVFKSEAAGRLARLAGSRSRTVWQELTVHPPHPYDDLPLLRRKLHDIEKITSESGKLEAQLAKMPREQASRFMDKQLRDTPQEAPPQSQGAPVPGVPGAIDLGPVDQQVMR